MMLNDYRRSRVISETNGIITSISHSAYSTTIRVVSCSERNVLSILQQRSLSRLHLF